MKHELPRNAEMDAALALDPEAYITKFEKPGYLQALFTLYGSRFAAYRAAWDEAASWVTPELPLHLELEVTNHCNLACPACHCAQYTHDNGNKKFMSLELLDRILENADQRIPAVLVGASSECLLHPQIEEILLRLSKAGIMDLMIHTNGLLLNERLAKFIVGLPLARINISVDAATPQTYRAVRGGRLELLEQNIERLLKYKEEAGSALPYVRLTFVKQPTNQHEIPTFMAKWQDRVDRIDIQELCGIQGNDTETTLCDADVHQTCAYPFRMLYVDYDGNVFPCCSFYYRFLKMGDMQTSSIDEIWKSDKMNQLRETFKQRKFFPVCRKCLNY